MRKPGRPHGSGYDDAAAIRQVLTLMQGEGTTRRSAIIRVCGHDQLRRLEIKMAARGVARNGTSKVMTDNSWGYGRRIGVDEGGAPVVLTPDDLKGSVVALGTTGSERTEFLLSLSESMLASGSGLIYVDGRGDARLPLRIAGMAAALGRGDDLQFLDFITPMGASSNPFASGSSETLTDLCIGIMGFEADDAVWKHRFIAMLSAVMAALVWKRDHEGLDLDVGVVKDHLGLAGIVGLAADGTLPAQLAEGILGYLRMLPEFEPDKGAEQGPVVRDQHGYIEKQLSFVLDVLADIHGEVLQINRAGVRFEEIARNRGILVVSIPGLNWPASRTRIVEKMVGDCLQRMLRDMAGKEPHFDRSREVEPDISGRPVFPIILDDIGAFMAEGMEALTREAHDLGFSLVFADDDERAIGSGNPDVAEAVLSNCGTRFELGRDGAVDVVQGDASKRLTRTRAEHVWGSEGPRALEVLEKAKSRLMGSAA